MKKSLLALALTAVVATPAMAASMTLHQFVARGTALEKKGPMALFHRGEIKALQTEMMSAGKQVREERMAAEKAGRKPTYCPPAEGKGVKMGAQEVLKELRLIAATQPKNATVADGWRAMLVKKFPCR